ncbi:RICIN domain-containing protein [Streptomyces thinghirensis]|nr:RICIN domain-containing protein [Streptomyces thinghirensis]
MARGDGTDGGAQAGDETYAGASGRAADRTAARRHPHRLSGAPGTRARHQPSVLAYARLCTAGESTARQLAARTFALAARRAARGTDAAGPWRHQLLLLAGETAAEWAVDERSAGLDAGLLLVVNTAGTGRPVPPMLAAFRSLPPRAQGMIWYGVVDREPRRPDGRAARPRPPGRHVRHTARAPGTGAGLSAVPAGRLRGPALCGLPAPHRGVGTARHPAGQRRPARPHGALPALHGGARRAVHPAGHPAHGPRRGTAAVGGHGVRGAGDGPAGRRRLARDARDLAAVAPFRAGLGGPGRGPGAAALPGAVAGRHAVPAGGERVGTSSRRTTAGDGDGDRPGDAVLPHAVAVAFRVVEVPSPKPSPTPSRTVRPSPTPSTPSYRAPGGTYSPVVNVASGRCLDIDGGLEKGTDVVTAPCTSSHTQLWRVDAGRGVVQSYADEDYCLDSRGPRTRASASGSATRSTDATARTSASRWTRACDPPRHRPGPRGDPGRG